MSEMNLNAIQKNQRFYLLGVSPQALDFRSIQIVFASQNIINCEWTKFNSMEYILNRDISSLFDSNVVLIISKIVHKHLLMDMKHNSMTTSAYSRSMRRGAPFSCVMCDSILCISFAGCPASNIFLIEIEDLGHKFVALREEWRISLAEKAIIQIKESSSIENVVNGVCDVALELLNIFDTAVAIRYLDDDSSEIVVDTCLEPTVNLNCSMKRSAHASRVGQRIPASAIPKETRDMLLLNGFRVIFDVDAGECVVHQSNACDQVYDLSMLTYSAVSECYLEYLRIINVHSSLTFAIVVNGVLWGLYIFHSHTKVCATQAVTFEQRTLVETIVTASADKIASFATESGLRRKENIIRLTALIPEQDSASNFLCLYCDEILAYMECHSIIVHNSLSNTDATIYGDQSMKLKETGYKILLAHKDFRLNSPLVLSDFTAGLEGSGAGIIIFKISETSSLSFVRRSRSSNGHWIADNYLYQSEPRHKHQRVESRSNSVDPWSTLDVELAQHMYYQISQALHLEMVNSFKSSLAISDAKWYTATENAKRNNEFFAHMSHEIRSPFHGVIASLQILKSGGSSIPEHERMDIIDGALECSESMLGTLDDILTIAKESQSGAEDIRRPSGGNISADTLASFDIINLMPSISRRMQPIAENKSVKFQQQYGEIHIQGRPVRVEDMKSYATLVHTGDETRIIQIISNLTSNAIKFTPARGTVQLRVSLLPESRVDEVWNSLKVLYTNSYISVYSRSPETNAEGSIPFIENLLLSSGAKIMSVWLVIEVHDTACGIPETSMAIMFDPYQQLSSGANKTYQGTGLGLHIVRLHTQKLNGMLAVASTPGHGSVFFCAFPIMLRNETVFHDDFSTSSYSKQMESTLLSTNKSDLNVGVTATSRSSCSVELGSALGLLKDCNLGGDKNNVEHSVKISITNYNQTDNNLKPIFLIVDDSKLNIRLLIKKISMEFGDSVECLMALNGNAAVEVYKSLLCDGKIDQLAGIFMDYHMPVCTGVGAINQIRFIEMQRRIRSTYIIGFTADMTNNSSNSLLTSGANEVMSKPSPEGHVEDVCRRLIQELLQVNHKVIFNDT